MYVRFCNVVLVALVYKIVLFILTVKVVSVYLIYEVQDKSYIIIFLSRWKRSAAETTRMRYYGNAVALSLTKSKRPGLRALSCIGICHFQYKCES